MKKSFVNFNLPITVLREKKRFIAYSPALDLSTSGKSYKEAQKRFTEAAVLFFEEIINQGTIAEVLEELGWQKAKQAWQSPLVVAQHPTTISIPIGA